MVEIMLVDEICAFLEEIFEDYLVEDGTGKVWPITIINSFLPPKKTDKDEDYEKFCILVRVLEGEDNFSQADGMVIATIRTIIAVRTASMDVKIGPKNTLNLMQRIRQRIYASPILAKRFRAVFPLKWKAPAGDTLPFWQGEMTIPWIMPVPQELWIKGDEDY